MSYVCVYIYICCFAQVSPKAAESLADPEEYPNLFEDWQVAVAVESKAVETRLDYENAKLC